MIPQTKRDIERFFNNSIWFGFTGTPIFEENKYEQKGDLPQTTEELYGPCLHSYTIKEAIHDGAVLDFYLLGVKSPVREFTGKVIAVYHRYDDNETKWIVVPCDDEGVISENVVIPTDDEIYAQIAFQEQFFCGVLVK